MWFESLTGFAEKSPQQVRSHLTLEGDVLKSHVNGISLVCGRLETPTLAELRERANAINAAPGKMSVREVVANVQHLHADPANAGALFQVASQFNLLEMVSPNFLPEQGVGIYEHDPTQGPACAIAAGAGTIYRNYFAKVRGQIGQSAGNQLDCLEDIGTALGNSDGRLWKMRNGYALATLSGLEEINVRIKNATENEVDKLRQLLRIGIQWNTQVTLGGARHTVSQAYCSALPVAYSGLAPHLWAPFARLVLEASYEATLSAAVINLASRGNNRLYLTFVGGGAFGNGIEWIIGAVQRALKIFQHVALDVAVVSYGSPSPYAQQLVTG